MKRKNFKSMRKSRRKTALEHLEKYLLNKEHVPKYYKKFPESFTRAKYEAQLKSEIEKLKTRIKADE